ncbi:MAG: thioredoxin family protein [bacterium]
MKRLSCCVVAAVMGVGIISCLAEGTNEGSKATVAPSALKLGAASGKTTWLTSLETAKTEAAKRNVPILADFSGSDWCGWCIKLDKEVFSTPAFKKYASENLVLLLVDFPNKKHQTAEIKKQNAQLQKKLGIQGYPTVVLMDAEGQVLGQTGYQPGGGEKYVAHLQELLGKK